MKRGLGWIEEKDSGEDIDELFGASVTRTTVQEYADLTHYFPPVENQSSSSACVAFSCLAAFEGMRAYKKQASPKLSRRFAYYNARMLTNPLRIEDTGTQIGNLLTQLRDIGCALDESCRFDIEVINEKPSFSTYFSAYRNRSAQWYSIRDQKIFNVKTAISLGHPVVFGTDVDESFLHLSSHSEGHAAVTNNSVGRHAMVIVGYQEDVFKVRNSWGTNWGNSGYWWMQADFLASSAVKNLTAITVMPEEEK